MPMEWRPKMNTDGELNDCFEQQDWNDNDAALLDRTLRQQDSSAFLKELTAVVRARGFMSVAQQTGLNRTWLYRSISPSGNPRLCTLITLLSVIGLRLSVAPVAVDHPAEQLSYDPYTAG